MNLSPKKMNLANRWINICRNLIYIFYIEFVAGDSRPYRTVRSGGVASFAQSIVIPRIARDLPGICLHLKKKEIRSFIGGDSRLPAGQASFLLSSE
jgi:hypothetical protein